MVCIHPVSAADRMATILGSTYEINNDDELRADSDVAQFIWNVIRLNDPGYGRYNRYGEGTTSSSILSAAEGEGYDYAISFYIGHGDIEETQPPYNYCQWCICTDAGGWVHDYKIHPHSTSRHVRFAFLWSCFQGNVIGGLNPPNPPGTPFGMPHAWLHTTSLSQNGYSYPDYGGYAFIGFWGPAPFLIYDLTSGNNWTGYHFAKNFYEGVFEYRYPLKQALDHASWMTWPGQNLLFDDTVFWYGYEAEGETGRMMVYGDSWVYPPTQGQGGGCPMLSVYDGSEYVSEGLIDIHNPDCKDVVRTHILITTPQPVGNAYLIRLTEHPKTHSKIDQVKLYARLENGATIQLPLTRATYNQEQNVLPLLLRSDDRRVNNNPNDTIDLRFRALPPNIEATCFVLQIEGYNDEWK
jgi:hypothetical protein